MEASCITSVFIFLFPPSLTVWVVKPFMTHQRFWLLYIVLHICNSQPVVVSASIVSGLLQLLY